MILFPFTKVNFNCNLFANNRYSFYNEDESESKQPGMKRLMTSGGGLDVEESKNVMEISVPSWKMDTDLVIQVPANTSLELQAINNGSIRVENVNGDILLRKAK